MGLVWWNSTLSRTELVPKKHVLDLPQKAYLDCKFCEHMRKGPGDCGWISLWTSLAMIKMNKTSFLQCP